MESTFHEWAWTTSGRVCSTMRRIARIIPGSGAVGWKGRSALA
nr:hypothetical protein [Kineosporia sp. A_224]